MSKPDWVMQVEKVLTHFGMHTPDWGKPQTDMLNRALVKLLRAERARSRRVVRMAKQQMADSLDASVGPLVDDSWVGYAQACDEILQRLK